MTTRPTVEPAGVSEERLRNLRAWAAARVGSLSGADITVAAVDELLAARQQLAELQRRIGLPVGVLCDRLDSAEQQLAEMRAERDSALSIACPECVKASAALAPTSQPSRGKCELCGGTGNAVVDYCADCNGTGLKPDCAQPERQVLVIDDAPYNLRPSPPQDDIVAGLRAALAGNIWAVPVGAHRPLLERAIAALLEKRT